MGGAGAGEFLEGVAHGGLGGVLGAGIAKDPDAGGLSGTRQGRSDETADPTGGGRVFAARFAFVVTRDRDVEVAGVGLEF